MAHDETQESTNTANRTHALRTFLITIVTLIILAGFGVRRYGSIKAAIATISGKGVIVDSATKSFGDANAHEEKHVDFLLTNITSQVVNILGITRSCTCMSCDLKLPFEIGAGDSKRVRISVSPPASPPRFDRGVRFYTNLPNQPEIILVVKGTVHSGNKQEHMR